MEPSDDLSLSRPSPRRELQGPRPAPLKVRKDSHKIKKPPPAAAAAPPGQSRPPVIIYTVSPKVIHANRSEFMSLVQRLTGPASSLSTASTAAGGGGGGAALEKMAPLRASPLGGGDHVFQQLGIDRVVSGRATGFSPAGILSPVPSSLPPVAAELFATGAAAAVQYPLNFFNELSPSFNGNKGGSSGGGFVENSEFLPFSPNFNNNFASTPILPSPSACWDLFSQNHGF